MNVGADKTFKILKELIGAKCEAGITSGLYKGSYSSRLEDFSEDGELALAHPMLKGALLPMSRSLEFGLRIDGSGCFYQSTVTVTRRIVNVPVPLLWVKLTSPLEKIQRRMFVRVPCSIKGRAFLMEVDHEEGTEPPEIESRWFDVRLNDISLGGVGLSVLKKDASQAFVNGRYLLYLTIEESDFFIVCRAIKIFKKHEDGRLDVGMAYEGLPAFTERLMGAFIRQQELSTRT